MKIVVYAGSGGSGGLRGEIRGFLSKADVPEAENMHLFVICTRELGLWLQDYIAPNVTLIMNDEAKGRLYRMLLGNRLPASVRKQIDEIAPDIVFYMGNTIQKGSEKYLNVVGFHNQLFVDKKQMRRQRFGTTLISLLLQKYFSFQSARKADLVVFESGPSMRQARQSGLKFRNAIVANYGIRECERSAGKTDFSLHDPIRMLYISTLYPYKNQTELIRGVEEIKRRGYSVQLDLVGTGPEFYLKEIKKCIRETALTENVVLHSWVEHDRIGEMIDAADLFVYGSSIETSGFGLMEGMARGAVILANNESCIPDILQDGGLLFDVHDPKSFADAFETAVGDEALRRKLAAAASRVSAGYTWENHSRAILGAFSVLVR